MKSSDHIPPEIELEALGERHCFALSEAIMIDRHPQDWIDQLVGQGVDASDTVEIVHRTIRAVVPHSFRSPSSS